MSQNCCLLLLFYVLFSPGLQAQSDEKDSAITSTAYNNALRQYHAYLSPETGLYRGPRYVEYAYQLAEGHPYFQDGHMHKGTVTYDGILYQDLLLLYDMVKDQLVANNIYGTYKLFFINQQVDSFTIGEHIFISLKDSLNPTAPRNGFYEQLYKGQISLLKKDRKLILEDVQLDGVKKHIDSVVTYYIRKGNNYYSVGSKRSLTNALKDRNKELTKFIRQNRLSVRRDLENTLIKVSAWYDSPATHQ